MKLKITITVLLILWLVPYTVLCAEKKLASPHFDVRYDTVSENYAEFVSTAAERSFAVISRTLGHTPENKITVVLTSTAEEFRTLTHGTLPDWSAAVAVPGSRIIISPLPGLKMNIEHILAHEIVHIIIQQVSGGRSIPRWFHEGCAETLSGGWGIRGRLYMVWKVSHGELLRFDEIEHLFSAGSNDVTLAYDQSMLAVKRLIAVYGTDVIPRILDEVGSGRNFESAFMEAVGITTTVFEEDYLTTVAKKYGKRVLITLIPGTWTFIMILAFVVYFIKKRRSKRLMSEWEVVEAAENIIKFRPHPPDM